jgi:hypothetical protein
MTSGSDLPNIGARLVCPPPAGFTLVHIRSASSGGFDLPTAVIGSGRVPHVRQSGTWAENGFFQCFHSMGKDSCFLAAVFAT